MADLNTVNQVTTTLHNSKDALESSFRQAYEQIAMLAPKVLVTIAVLVVGYVIARLVAKLIASLSETIGLQIAAERSGLAESMCNMGIRRSVPAIVGTIVFWLLMCVFVTTAFNILGLQKLSDAMGNVVDYIPNLLVATVVIVVGLLVASFLRGVVAHQRRPRGVELCGAPGQRLLLCPGLADLLGRLQSVGAQVRALGQTDPLACGGLVSVSDWPSGWAAAK